MSESNGTPESQLVQDTADNVQQSSSLDSHDTQSSSSETTDSGSIIDDSRETLLGTRLNKPLLLDSTNASLESPSEISGSSPTIEYSVELMDTSSPESTITGEKHTVNREYIQQPSTESKSESDISLEVGKNRFRVVASQEPSVSGIHLESFKSNRREHSVEKSQHLATSASLEKINKSEKRKFSPKKTSIPYEETASESVEFNLTETTTKVTTRNVGKALDVCLQLSQPGLFSPGTRSDTSSGFDSPTYQRKKARIDYEDDLQTISDSNSPKSEVSETSTIAEKVQRSKNVGNRDISQEPFDAEATQRCRKILSGPSQSNKEPIEISPDSSETEGHSSESICMPASEEAKVATSGDAAASTSSQTYVSAFIDYTNKKFEEKVKDVIHSFTDDIIYRHALYETACKKQTKRNLFLTNNFGQMDDIYKDFCRAKAFLLTLFSSDLITDENKIGQGFCTRSETRDLDLEDEFRKVIPRKTTTCLEIMWCQYFVVVDFLIKNSNNIFKMFTSPDEHLVYYSDLCMKFHQFLRKDMKKINWMKNLRNKNGNDDFKSFGDLNLALTTVIINLEALLIYFEKHVRNIDVIDLTDANIDVIDRADP